MTWHGNDMYKCDYLENFPELVNAIIYLCHNFSTSNTRTGVYLGMGGYVHFCFTQNYIEFIFYDKCRIFQWKDVIIR